MDTVVESEDYSSVLYRSDTSVDVESFRYSVASEHPVPNTKHQRAAQRAFIRGPLSLAWFMKASLIPRRSALVVGLTLWYLAGLRSKTNGLVLSASRCKPFGLGRKSVGRGLRDLEGAGLISVVRERGQAPRVDLLLEIPGESS